MNSCAKNVCAIILLAACAKSPALADVPPQMNIVGRLADSAGVPVPTGSRTFTFKIFDQQSGGMEIWPGGPGETQVLVTDSGGYWQGNIGQVIPLTEAVFQSPVRWLEITVDDGIQPAETLTRVQLSTVPYSYRSATSQHADSLGSSTLADLVDRFVDRAADTMSGPLRIHWDTTNARSPFEVENINNVYGSAWNDFTGTWGVAVDANSDDGSYSVGLASAARGDNTTNYGVYGMAKGLNSTNTAVYGEASGGTSNLAGVFVGDLVVTSLPGNQHVQLPVNSISSPEILDEPGLASSARSVPFAVTSVFTTYATVTLNCPDSGFVLVLAEATFDASAESTYVTVQLRENGLASIVWDWDPGDADGWSDHTQSQHVVRPVSAGPYTWELKMNTNSGTCAGTGAKLTALYVPTAYGAVSSPALHAQGEEDPRVLNTTVSNRATSDVDVDGERVRSLAANQARMDSELNQMRQEIEALRSQLARPDATQGLPR